MSETERSKLRLVYDEGELILMDDREEEPLALLVDSVRLLGDSKAIESFESLLDDIETIEGDVNSIGDDIEEFDSDLHNLESTVDDLETEFETEFEWIKADSVSTGEQPDDAEPAVGETEAFFSERETDEDGNIEAEATLSFVWNDGDGIYRSTVEADERLADSETDDSDDETDDSDDETDDSDDDE